MCLFPCALAPNTTIVFRGVLLSFTDVPHIFDLDGRDHGGRVPAVPADPATPAELVDLLASDQWIRDLDAWLIPEYGRWSVANNPVREKLLPGMWSYDDLVLSWSIRQAIGSLLVGYAMPEHTADDFIPLYWNEFGYKPDNPLSEMMWLRSWPLPDPGRTGFRLVEVRGWWDMPGADDDPKPLDVLIERGQWIGRSGLKNGMRFEWGGVPIGSNWVRFYVDTPALEFLRVRRLAARAAQEAREGNRGQKGRLASLRAAEADLGPLAVSWYGNTVLGPLRAARASVINLVEEIPQ